MPSTFVVGTAAMLGMVTPPAEYDHPFDGKIFEQALPQDQLQELCFKMSGGQLHQAVLACSNVGQGSEDGLFYCFVVLPEDPAYQEKLRRIVVAGCNGWHKRQGQGI